MIAWFHNLPIGWIAFLVFVVIYLVAGGIYWLVMALAVGEWARAFKTISPGMLPPLGIIFGLLVGFIAAQVWSDFDRARADQRSDAGILDADERDCYPKFTGYRTSSIRRNWSSSALWQRCVDSARSSRWHMRWP